MLFMHQCLIRFSLQSLNLRYSSRFYVRHNYGVFFTLVVFLFITLFVTLALCVIRYTLFVILVAIVFDADTFFTQNCMKTCLMSSGPIRPGKSTTDQILNFILKRRIKSSRKSNVFVAKIEKLEDENPNKQQSSRNKEGT